MASAPHFIRRGFPSNGCANFVKILKPECVLVAGPRYADSMNQPPVQKIQLRNTPEYRENYANSVQLRLNLWDFTFLFGRVEPTAPPDDVVINNFQAIYVSPQQAKALLNVLQQNVQQYENAFGEIRLQPQTPGGIVQ
jgi:hypothetical protein